MRSLLFFSLLVLFAFPACLLDEPPVPIPQEDAEGDLVPAPRDEVTSSSSPLSMPNSTPSLSSGYDRKRAVAYARYYADEPNPRVAYCRSKRYGTPADCTNFVSQALWYGGLKTAFSGNAEQGWWYSGSCDDSGSSKSWRQVNRLIYWLTVESDRGEFTRIENVRPGDLIFYKLQDDFGKCTDEFTFHHSTMVTGFGKMTGVPLVSYHTREVRDIPWNWSLREQGFLGLGDACSYVAVHIRD